MTHYTLKCLPYVHGDRWAILDAMGKAYGIFRDVLAAEARRLQMEHQHGRFRQRTGSTCQLLRLDLGPLRAVRLASDRGRRLHLTHRPLAGPSGMP